MDNLEDKLLNDRYLLDKKIGSGGMSIVYRAYDNVDNKTVAVKILKREYYNDSEFRRRFMNESRAVSVLNHPNIVKIYDVSLGDTYQYIVMEHIDGITLKEYLEKNGPLSWREAFGFASQILRALQHAHDKGVIHRDIKPQNILLLKGSKTVKVADFGIARFYTRDETGLIADDAMGSVRYSSPEQINGDHADNRTDIYSVGVILYEMVTGKVPFTSDSAISIALMQMNQPVVPPRHTNPSIPVGVEQIIMKAMMKNPDDRYGSANEMLADMSEITRNPSKILDHSVKAVSPRPTYRQKIGEPEKPTTQQVLLKNSASTNQRPHSNIEYYGPNEFNEEEKAIASRNYTLPILWIFILTIVASLALSGWMFFARTDEINVPRFVGKYINNIKNEKEYKVFFDREMIEQNLVYTTDYKDGYIISQSVEAGTKMKVSHSASSLIRLNVAYTSASIKVPDIAKGTKLQNARAKLRKMGFKIKSEAVVNMTLEESSIIKMEPAPGTNVSYGSTVTLYYAIHDAKKVAIPSVVGSNVKDAREELESLGIKVKIRYRESSGENVDIVLSQSIAADTPVIAKNTEVTIVVGQSSAGKKVSFTIELPKITGEKEVQNVSVYVGKSLYKKYSSVKLDGSDYDVDISGTGITTFKIYIGEKLYVTGDVDFTETPPSIKNKKTEKFTVPETTTAEKPTATTTAAAKPNDSTTKPRGETVALPSYAGKDVDAYLDELDSLGFDNVNVIREPSDSVEKNMIIEVRAEKDKFTRDEAANMPVRVYVSTGER